ncbi:hypothetical protein HDV00_001270 [Rhizophlyctis rosea]|nr:hypothetical protein HDV00_001270 [Rhizophlyctis rosea]
MSTQPKEGDHPTTCCTLPPFASDYTPKGHTENVGDLPVYFTGAKGKKAIIVIYDIFGELPLTQQFADRLADSGFYVAMPDYFRGAPWSKVPFERAELMAYLQERVPFDQVMKPDTLNVIQHLKSQGVESVGALGFCWGGLHTSTLGSHEDVVAAGLKGVSSVHPSFHTVDTVKDLKVPVAFIPTQDEADFTPIMESIANKPFASKNVHVRFDDVHHGFAAARANYADPVNVKRSGEAVQILNKFFNEVL